MININTNIIINKYNKYIRVKYVFGPLTFSENCN